MHAFKFLRAGGVGPFSGFAWPRPDGDAPGPWVEAAPFRGACGAGIHACDADHLVYWLDRELWAVELDGPVVTAAKKLVAPRGRLLRRVDGWDPALARTLVVACVAHARAQVAALDDDAAALARGYLADAEAYGAADAAAGIFCAAHAALTADGFARERRWQSRWLAAQLGLR